MKFLSTPSARRATPKSYRQIASKLISIHALREEGDLFKRIHIAIVRNFYPRPPRGGRLCKPVNSFNLRDFYPRPPRGGRPPDLRSTLVVGNFYPRPPRGGRPLTVVSYTFGS